MKVKLSLGIISQIYLFFLSKSSYENTEMLYYLFLQISMRLSEHNINRRNCWPNS